MTAIVNPGQEVLDSAGAAEVLHTSERHVRRLRAEHDLPYIRLGTKIRFLRGDLDDYVANSRVTGKRGAV